MQQQYNEIKEFIESIVVTAKLIGYEINNSEFTTYLMKDEKQISILQPPIGNLSLVITVDKKQTIHEGICEAKHNVKMRHLKIILETL